MDAILAMASDKVEAQDGRCRAAIDADVLKNDWLAQWAVSRFGRCPKSDVGNYEDCLQEVRFALFRAMMRFQPGFISRRTGRPVAKSSYLVQAMIHAASRWRRTRRRQGFTQVDDSSKNPAKRARKIQPVRIDSTKGSKRPLTWVADQRANHLVDLAGDRQDLDRAMEQLRQHRPSLYSVIHGRFYRGLSLREIGLEMNVSRQRVQQIEAKALRRLRSLLRVTESPS